MSFATTPLQISRSKDKCLRFHNIKIPLLSIQTSLRGTRSTDKTGKGIHEFRWIHRQRKGTIEDDSTRFMLNGEGTIP